MLKLNFTGVHQFLKIMNLLRKDINPSEEIWDELFANPGYTKLIQIELSREFFQQYFKIAYMPSKNQERQEIAHGDNEIIKNILLHYINVLKNEDKINNFLTGYKSRINEKRILKYTMEYLPANGFSKEAEIFFLVFANDARDYDIIIFDVLFALNMEDQDLLELILAHELHHLYRNKILCFDITKIEAEDRGIIMVINQIHSEGVADQIDTEKWIYDGYHKIKDPFLKNYAMQYRELCKKAPELIMKLDKKMIDIFIDCIEDVNNINLYLPLSGHVIGYYMVNKVMEICGQDIIIETVNNPFQFFEIYNTVAKEHNLVAFSESIMGLIKEMEKKYVLGL